MGKGKGKQVPANALSLLLFALFTRYILHITILTYLQCRRMTKQRQNIYIIFNFRENKTVAIAKHQSVIACLVNGVKWGGTNSL